jgi:uncharacterized membrane protein YkvA (DUF1232 family)
LGTANKARRTHTLLGGAQSEDAVVRPLCCGVAAYALSPIDLIPDFLPVVGYLDDLLIVPLGILPVIRLIPAEMPEEHRAAAARLAARPISYAAAAFMIGLWAVAAIALCQLLEPRLESWLR